MIVAVVFSFWVDPDKKKLKETCCWAERRFSECKKDLKKTTKSVTGDKNIRYTFEIFKILIVGLFGCIKYLFHKDHNTIEEFLILNLSKKLL